MAATLVMVVLCNVVAAIGGALRVPPYELDAAIGGALRVPPYELVAATRVPPYELSAAPRVPPYELSAAPGAPPHTGADSQHTVTGMVVAVDPVRRTMTVSHERIPGLMEAMTMPFEVRDARELRDLVPGAVVAFTLVVGDRASYATRIVVKRYETVERDPRNARRLSLMKRIAGMATEPVVVGARVPDFTLTDQRGRAVRLSMLAGQVVAVNFVYTRCALPQFCLRMANAFGAVQKRFQKEIGRDLTLLTITFDPERDTPEVLRAYADRWTPHATGWRFLTGNVGDIARVSAFFGQEAFPEEGLINHSLHTAIIGRTGTLVANIEGNQFTPEQLGDLIAATLRR